MSETKGDAVMPSVDAFRRGLGIFLVAAIYFGAARLGLLLASVHGSVSPVWPATGVAIGVLLIGGVRLWPGVALGAFLANALTTVSPIVALGICAGNTLEALAGAWLATWYAVALRRCELEHLAEPAAYGLTAAVAPVISASCGVFTLLAGGEIPWSMAGTLWLTWWVGDALGALTIMPLLLAVRDALRERSPWSTRDIMRAATVTLAIVFVCTEVFFRPVDGAFAFLVFPVLFLSVAWFGSTGVKLAAFLISVLSIGAAFFGSGPFAGGTLNEDLMHLQLFLASVATAALLLPVIRATGRLFPLSFLLLSGWALAGWLLSSLDKDRLRQDSAHFDALVADTADRIGQRLRTYEDLLRGGAGLFVASKSAGGAEWRAYVQTLRLSERYPGIRGLAVVFPVRPEHSADFVASTRAGGVSDFTIKAVPGGARPPYGPMGREHFVVTYVEPLEANRSVLGLDLASEINRRTAAEESRDTGEPRITRTVVPAQDIDRRPEFLLFVPLYRPGAPIENIAQRREALTGWVNAAFFPEEFLRGVPGPRSNEIALRLFEGRSAAPERLLYDSSDGTAAAPKVERVTLLDLGGQVFAASWSRGPGFMSSDESPALWAAAASALVSLLMVGLVVSLQSVSRRARAAVARRTEELVASEERFRLLIENVQDYAIIVLDPAGLVTTWNRGAERIKGYAAGEITGRHFAIFYPPAEVADGRPARALAAAAAHDRMEDEGWRIRKDGTRFWANGIITVLRNRQGAPVGFVEITRDITERKRLEENLARARDEALEASRFKSEFLATVSHEIRTPMNGVIGMAGLLMQTSLTAEQRRMGRVIENSAESLLRIINDILDFSAIEAGRLRFDSAEFQVREVVEETLALFAPRAEEKRLELICDFDSTLQTPCSGDAGRIRQVLTNLVGNAIKFTEQGEVVVTVRRIDSPEGRTAFRVAVSDTGMGIAETARERLFEPFTQADGTSTRRFGGTGLGLAICRRLIDLMGGKLGFESRPGRGTTFWFELMLPSGTARASEELIATIPLGLRVLVVDDNATSRQVLLEQLAHFGLKAEAIAESPAALARLRGQAAAGTPCQLVLLDWQMPQMNGLELAVAIRADPALAHLPLVMLSSSGPLADPATVASVGFAAFLTKPVREAQLHRCLARILDSQENFAVPATGGTDTADTVAEGGGLQLLLVEDNLSNQMVARMLFERMGHTVTVAGNGKEAITRLTMESFDAVIMDCQMPVMDGYEATRQIRSGRQPGLVPWVPVIALTAHAMSADREKCLNAGMDDYMTKPVRMTAIQEAFLRCGLIKGAVGFQSARARALRYHKVIPAANDVPANRPAADPVEAGPAPARGAGETFPPIIVVDDDPNDIALFRQGLDDARVECPIIAFTSGEETVDFLTRAYVESSETRQPLPRVIFLDIVMRRMNGYQVLSWIRGQEALRKVKVIMVSSISTPREIELSHELGADQHLVKYPVPEVLAQIVALAPSETKRG